MTTVALPPDIATALGFRWNHGQSGRLVVTIPPEGAAAEVWETSDPIVRRIVLAFFNVGHWDDVLYLTDAIHDERSFATDLRAIYFDRGEDRVSETPLFVIFRIEDASDNALCIETHAFVALAARWLAELRAGAELNADTVTEAAWWPEWVRKVDDIVRLAGDAAAAA
jgi:hypothetical protein